MTRIFLDTVRANLTAQLTSGGNITAPELNALLQDVVDSTVQDECAITGVVPTPFASTVAWQSIAVGYTEVVGGDAVFLKPDLPNGVVQTSAVAGYTYELELFISFEDLASGQRADFSILRNGQPVGFLSANQGEGNNDPVTATAKFVELAAPLNADYTIGIRTPQGPRNLNILSLSLVATIQPTNNP